MNPEAARQPASGQPEPEDSLLNVNDALPRFAGSDDGMLSDEMLDAFRKTGVLVLEDFATESACAALQARAAELVREFDPETTRSVFSSTEQTHAKDRYFIESGDKIRFFLETEAFDENGELRQGKQHSLNKMGHAMHDLDPVFDRFSRSQKLAATIQCLGFQAPLLLQSMYIFKPPRIGGEVIFHQDSTYLYTEPESCIGLWFALEDATLENGCMQFIPGAHHGPLKARNFRTGDFATRTAILDDEPWPLDNALAAPAKTGTLVIFDGRSPHCSGPNRSDRSRHAFTLHVIDQASHYPADNWLQRGEDLPLRGFE